MAAPRMTRSCTEWSNAHGEGTDDALRGRFQLARRTRELKGTVDADALALMASSLLFSLAIRARAGIAKRELKTMIQGGVDLLLRS